MTLGFTKCPEWFKTALKRATQFTCQDCLEVYPENELEIHRIKQGYKGGRYIGNNSKVLCHECHNNYAEGW